MKVVAKECVCFNSFWVDRLGSKLSQTAWINPSVISSFTNCLLAAASYVFNYIDKTSERYLHHWCLVFYYWVDHPTNQSDKI